MVLPITVSADSIEKVQKVIATDADEDSIDFYWNEVQYADYYEVQYSKKPNEGFLTKKAEGYYFDQYNPYYLNGLAAGTVYYVRVRAVNEDVDSGKKSYGTFSDVLKTATCPKKRVSGLKQTKATETSVNGTDNVPPDKFLSNRLFAYEKSGTAPILASSYMEKQQGMELKADTLSAPRL